jgi:hypothetical protein
MKTSAGVEIQLHAFLTSALDRGVNSNFRSAVTLTMGKLTTEFISQKDE